MAMGRRRREAQGALWIAASELPRSGGHPFYEQVNKILDAVMAIDAFRGLPYPFEPSGVPCGE